MVTLPLLGFIAVTSLILMFYFLAGASQDRVDARLERLSKNEGAEEEKEGLGQMARTMLPKIGEPLIPVSAEERSQLQTRLVQAGYYSPGALSVFMGTKMMLMLLPVLLGAVIGMMSGRFGESILVGALLGVFGSIGSSIWLDYRKKSRQTSFRRSLPDALDVLVVCLEGGLSLIAAFRRMGGELRVAHPLLSSEINIVLREVQLGLTPGEALRHFADRADMEELRGLSAVVLQADRLGSGMANALRVHSEALRFKRLQAAEEQAQKASVKMLFPTLFLIFPGIFVVVLGPAAIQLLTVFSQLKK